MLNSKTNDEIDLDILKAYLEAVKEYRDTNIACVYPPLNKLKYDAPHYSTTTIEKTMTPAQLYVLDSPYINRTAGLSHLHDKPRTEETFNNALWSDISSFM